MNIRSIVVGLVAISCAVAVGSWWHIGSERNTANAASRGPFAGVGEGELRSVA